MGVVVLGVLGLRLGMCIRRIVSRMIFARILMMLVGGRGEFFMIARLKVVLTVVVTLIVERLLMLPLMIPWEVWWLVAPSLILPM